MAWTSRKERPHRPPKSRQKRCQNTKRRSPDPNGMETASSDPAPDGADGALAEIEEAISDGEDDEVIEVEEANLSYPIRKPFRSKKRFEFFMAHPDPALWIKAWVVVENLGMEEAYYLPTGNVRGELLDHLVQVEFVPCLNSRERFSSAPSRVRA